MQRSKLVVVAYPIGRIGSSALMGLLKISGLNVGREDSLVDAAPMNPKGFFELKSQQKFLTQVYPGIYPDVSNPPRLEVIDEIGERNFLAYENLLKAEFDDVFPIVVKSQRFLTLPFLYRLQSKYDIRVLVLSRNTIDMVRSIKRVWEHSENPIQKNASISFIEEWLARWMEFANKVQKYYVFDYYRISFDDLLLKQTLTMKDIASFLEIDCPAEAAIHGWLDKGLTNRQFLK